MADSNPLPTFRTNKDRLVYLISEFRWPLLAVAIAAGIWASLAIKEIPRVPASWLDFSLAWGILAFPSYLVGLKLVKWLHTRDWERVATVDGSSDDVASTTWKVPPETWADRSETGASALPVSEGRNDFLVQKFEWYDDIGELEVRGFERADMDPDTQFMTARKVDEYYQYHHVVRRLYTNLKGLVHDKISQVHDATVMQMLQQRETGEVGLDVEVTDLIAEMEDDLEDLPDGPTRDSRPEPQRYHDIETMDDLGDLGIDDSAGPVSPESSGQQPAATDGGSEQ